MIKANHKAWAKKLFKIYIYRKFKKSFHSFKLIGNKPKFDKNKSILLLCNHSTWWDGFFTFYWNEELFQKKFHIMMLEDQLKRFHFFQKLGAYSIKHESPKKIIEAINYSKELISNPYNLVNIYPEGEMKYSFRNDINYKKGILRVLDNNFKYQVVSLGMKIHHLHEEKPEVFFKFKIENNTGLKNLEQSMNNLLTDIEKNIGNSKIIFEGTKSKSE